MAVDFSYNFTESSTNITCQSLTQIVQHNIALPSSHRLVQEEKEKTTKLLISVTEKKLTSELNMPLLFWISPVKRSKL